MSDIFNAIFSPSPWYWLLGLFVALIILLRYKPFEFLLNELMKFIRFIVKIVSYEAWRWGYHLVYLIIISHQTMIYHLINRKKDISKLDELKERHHIKDHL